jgi:hypothetical protein
MIYCGNNANHNALVNGQVRLGTRFECLQKGKQIGLAQPVDPSFAQPYQPIDPLRKYCGNQANIPNGYNRFGTLHECMLTGIGVGKRIKATNPENKINNHDINNYIEQDNAVVAYPPVRNENRVPKKIILSIIIFLIIFSSLFIGLYYGKPSFITKYNNDKKEDEIDWSKFIPYILLFSIIVAILVYIIVYKII